LSDGAPDFFIKQKHKIVYHYKGKKAQHHTAAQIRDMKAANIIILSYLIREMQSDLVEAAFKTMYGADGKIIDTGNMMSIVSSLNHLFLKKS